MATSRKDSFRIQVLQITDAVLVWLAFFLAAELRDPVLSLLRIQRPEFESLKTILWVLYIAVPFTPLVLERFGFYNRLRRKTVQRSGWQLIQGIFIIGLAIALLAIFAKLNEPPRLILGNAAILIFFLLFLRERAVHCWMSRSAKNQGRKERLILAGSDAEISDFLKTLDPDAVAGWDIVERFDLATRPTDDLFEILKRESVGRVIFANRSTEFEKVSTAVEICELQGVEAWIAASFIRTQIARPVFDSVGARPMLVLRSTPELSWELLAKELMDRSLSLLAILVTSPLWVFAYVGIKLCSPGAPVFFTQMRSGRYGRPFKMYKFRTMVADAEKLLDKTKEEHGNQMQGPVFKLDHDPRIFRFGALLRKLSIDELPQFLNVLLGDMSLVGPRPLPLYEVEAFSEIAHRRRLSVKPGITCEWQAGGRNRITSFEEWVEMDLRYIDNWSLWLDFQILLKTIPAVLFGKGAG